MKSSDDYLSNSPDDIKIKIDYLREHIDRSINHLNFRRNENRNKASLIKVITVVCSGLITVLLGLQITGTEQYFKGAALILGAIVTILNALEPFFNYRALWISYEEAVADIYRLKTDMVFYLTGKPVELVSIEKLQEFLMREQDIWTMVRESHSKYRRSEERSV